MSLIRSGSWRDGRLSPDTGGLLGTWCQSGTLRSDYKKLLKEIKAEPSSLQDQTSTLTVTFSGERDQEHLSLGLLSPVSFPMERIAVWDTRSLWLPRAVLLRTGVTCLLLSSLPPGPPQVQSSDVRDFRDTIPSGQGQLPVSVWAGPSRGPPRPGVGEVAWIPGDPGPAVLQTRVRARKPRCQCREGRHSSPVASVRCRGGGRRQGAAQGEREPSSH